MRSLLAEVVPGAQIVDRLAVVVKRGGDHGRIKIHRVRTPLPAEQRIGHEVFDIVLVTFAVLQIADAMHRMNRRYVRLRVHYLRLSRNKFGNFEHIGSRVLHFIHVVAR